VHAFVLRQDGKLYLTIEASSSGHISGFTADDPPSVE